MIAYKELLILATLSIICLSVVKSEEQKSIEDLLEIEREFGTETYSFKNTQLNFLAETGSEVAPDPTPTPAPAPTKPSSFDNLISGLFKSSNVYLQMVEAFKTKRTSELDRIIEGKGFEHFAATGQVKITKGIKEEYIEKYVNNLFKIIKVPAAHVDAIEGTLSEIQFGEKNYWNNYKTAFDLGENSESKFCSIFTYKDEVKNVYDIVYLDFQGTFKLAPDTMVMKKTLMLLGGIWADDKVVFEKKDRALTPEALESVMNFFSILAFKGIGDVFGIKFEFPKF
jgi:hypothetical protein